MKTIFALLFVAASFVSGCAYAGVAATSDGRVVIARNDGFLYGLLRKVFVCNVGPTGVTNCQSAESP